MRFKEWDLFFQFLDLFSYGRSQFLKTRLRILKQSARSDGTDLPEEIFTERYLRNPPNTYFR